MGGSRDDGDGAGCPGRCARAFTPFLTFCSYTSFFPNCEYTNISRTVHAAKEYQHVRSRCSVNPPSRCLPSAATHPAPAAGAV